MYKKVDVSCGSEKSCCEVWTVAVKKSFGEITVTFRKLTSNLCIIHRDSHWTLTLSHGKWTPLFFFSSSSSSFLSQAKAWGSSSGRGLTGLLLPLVTPPGPGSGKGPHPHRPPPTKPPRPHCCSKLTAVQPPAWGPMTMVELAFEAEPMPVSAYA
jgi:hypothetical protein